MTAAISGSNSVTLTQQAAAIDESLSQRVGVLLKRAGISIEGDGPVELSLDSSGELIVGGDVTNKDAIFSALGDDTRLKNLLKAQMITQEQQAESSDSAVDDGSVAGVSKEALAELWSTIKEDPDGEEILEKVVTKLQVLDALGVDYEGEVDVQSILSSNSDKEYYKSLAMSLQASTPSIVSYLSDSSASGSYSLVDYMGSSQNSDQMLDFLTMDTNAAVAKAYSRINAASQSISTINFDA